ncbi:MAG: pyruvate kinase [Candidatus Moranbacteria bacterium CG23_combo_of_CG06-09_8_20_14_all_35_22]|nr:MAG: pyruvate kinase [Candidatus Moranbacteria bacterium CG23_combo_of_CG06-09_8_20_14_all_35_22]
MFFRNFRTFVFRIKFVFRPPRLAETACRREAGKHMKRTKIVATIGLSTSTKEKLKKIIKAGMNVARINFSHGDYASNGKLINYIKELRKEMRIPIGIMVDLQGPRIRTVVGEEIKIEKGEFILISDLTEKNNLQCQNSEMKCFSLDWPGILKNIKIKNEILIEDGLIKLKVVGKEKNFLQAQAINGGVIKNHKGVNIPDTNLQFGAVTKKDLEALKFALKCEADFIALSFVSNAKEIISIKNKIQKALGRKDHLPQIIAKIERKEAIKNIDEIIEASDGVMVARGDLGIEMNESKVVLYQKEIIAKCLKSATPVIVATQMLNSMIENPRPTRAEVGDVSNAVIDHADAVMLSGETANGKYPIQAVETMREIISNTEKSPFDNLEHGFLGDKKHSVSATIANSAHELLKDTRAKAIVVASVSGFTARMISRHRPESPIFIMTNNEKTHQQLSLVWGAQSFVLPDCRTMDELIDKSVEILKKEKAVKAKDKLIIVAGRPHKVKEHMSLVKVEEVR